MLVNASRLLNYPVLSLHMGGPIAWVDAEVVDPEKLKIVAFYVGGPIVKNDPEVGEILESRDVREFSNIGMIVDSEEVFVNQGDVTKLDKILSLNFSLMGLKVETKKGSKLGKIIDFVVDTETFMVHQLIVKRPVMKALLDPELIIPRKEIVEVNDYKIIVKDEEDKIRKKAVKEEFIPNFVNPFREPDFSASRIDEDESTK
ncbi:PRC-barrel domain-containing protein [Candidatus Saccharibacteria bacterium]|nr:PRC-barrel domain-containing protein [Candidatus Saccharibacteria bacterium]MBR6122522.1 PRC-barrel domain-containing protein [Candidatus Saccharibacteria bacterium]